MVFRDISMNQVEKRPDYYRACKLGLLSLGILFLVACDGNSKGDVFFQADPETANSEETTGIIISEASS